MKTLTANEEEVLETFYRHRLTKEEYEQMKRNYPSQVKKLEENYWITVDGSGKVTASGRGADIFRQFIKLGHYYVAPTSTYKRIYAPIKVSSYFKRNGKRVSSHRRRKPRRG